MKNQNTAPKTNIENATTQKAEKFPTMADFVLPKRPDNDIFAFAQPFHEHAQLYNSQYQLNMRKMVSANKNHVTIYDTALKKNRDMIMFGSNSYLGLNNHPRLKKAAKEAIDKYGVGAGSPPLFSGYYEMHMELEKELAQLKGTEDAIIFPSGYATNVGVLTAFLSSKDTVVLDRLAHASIIDGARMSGAKISTFKHNDLNSLERVLQQTKKINKGDCLVAVEGVYSMDGDIAALDEIYKLTQQYNVKLMVDEAHATGVLGSTGKGSPEHFDLEGKIDIVMGTFSKSLGGLGGFVCSSKQVVSYLRFFARSYFFAASPTPHQTAAHLEAVRVLKEEPQWHKQLWENIHYTHSHLRELGFDLENTQTAITPITIGETKKMFETHIYLHNQSLFINPVPYPAVARKKDRLRISITALHTKEDLDQLISGLVEADKKFAFRI